MLQPNIKAGVRDCPPKANLISFPECEWTNYDNISFYENVPLNIIQRFAVDTGLHNCCDVKMILPYVFQANSLLEVGAGYGRVLEFLLQLGAKQKLYALERCQKFIELLKLKFLNKAQILNIDLHNFQTHFKFDLILWLWGGIANFSKDEQCSMLNRLKNSLNTNGLMIIDALPASTKPIRIIQEKGQDYLIEANGKTLHAYCPSNEELIQYAKLNNLTLLERIDYHTETNMHRILYILKK